MMIMMMMTSNKMNKSTTMSLIALVVTSSVLLLAMPADAATLSQQEALRLCRQRTGLKEGDIKQYHSRNQNCAIDCETRASTLMTAFVEDGTACNDQDGYRCVMGVCRGEDNRISDNEFKSMELIDISSLSIRTAHVADRDPYPGQGESDAFVVVEVGSQSDGKPNYNGTEVVCHTHVVQDSSRPKWNYQCKPLPLRLNGKLKFTVLDSDKPDNQPQLLGHTTQTLETLLNAGPQTLILEQAKYSSSSNSGPYWLEVDIKGKKYSPGDF